MRGDSTLSSVGISLWYGQGSNEIKRLMRINRAGFAMGTLSRLLTTRLILRYSLS